MKLFGKIDELKHVIDEFTYSSCRYIFHIVGIDKNTAKKILIEDLHMQKICLRWVLHDLTESQKFSRLNVSKELLDIVQSLSKNQIKKIVTSDESWFFLWYGELENGHMVE